jgi:GNAT superfamily N-acetyltransferase
MPGSYDPNVAEEHVVATVPFDDRTAIVQRARAPLAPDVGARLAWFLEGAFETDHKPDLFVTVAAKGLLEDVARNDFAWAEVDGEIASAAWTTNPADEPRLATLGEVFTAPDRRGRKLAGAVCAALLDRFDAAGGRVIYLGTSEPPAARIYAGLGFRPFPRGLMRRDGPAGASTDAFDATWFRPSAVHVRPLTWGDTPRLVQLYAMPNPWVSAAWMQGLYSVSYQVHDRCNSLMKFTWQATRAGAWLGLVNEEGALVGSGPIQPHGNEKAVIGADVDLFVHPAFHEQAGVLLDAMAGEARHLGWRWLRTEVPLTDEAKRATYFAAGFRIASRMPGALELGGSLVDVEVLRLDL